MTAAVDVLTGPGGEVRGIITGDLGVGRDGKPKSSFARGIALEAKYTLIGEGARGSLAKALIRTFNLDAKRSPQKYGLGIKEIWEIPDSVHEPGRIDHYLGYPLDDATGGGGFCLPRGRPQGVPRPRRPPRLQEPDALALRRVPALQAAPRDRAACSTAHAASATAPAR